MLPILITPASGLPVSVDWCARYLQQNTDDENSLIEDCIREAKQLFEDRTGWSLLQATYRVYVDCFRNPVYLQRHPATEVVGVYYGDDTAEEPTEWSADNYTVDLRKPPGKITFSRWPSLTEGDRMWVDFKAGFTSTQNIDHWIRRALCQYVGTALRHRRATSETQMVDAPWGFEVCCNYHTLFAAGEDFNE